MNYRQLQQALKALKEDGYDVQVKLNAKTDILQNEYDRLTAQINEQKEQLEATSETDYLNLEVDLDGTFERSYTIVEITTKDDQLDEPVELASHNNQADELLIQTSQAVLYILGGLIIALIWTVIATGQITYHILTTYIAPFFDAVLTSSLYNLSICSEYLFGDQYDYLDNALIKTSEDYWLDKPVKSSTYSSWFNKLFSKTGKIKHQNKLALRTS